MVAIKNPMSSDFFLKLYYIIIIITKGKVRLMEKQEDIRSKENFCYFMECIKEYLDTFASTKLGTLYFVKDSLIAECSVTKYQQTTPEYFKAFFCNVVLELYNNTELNIKEYEKYFGIAQEKKKPYYITPTMMNQYLDREANVQFIIKFLKKRDIEEDCEGWETIFPILLIERLKKVSHQCLKEYFTLEKKTFKKRIF